MRSGGSPWWFSLASFLPRRVGRTAEKSVRSPVLDRLEGDQEMARTRKPLAQVLTTTSLVLGLAALAPTAARSDTCNGFLTIDYVTGPSFALPGDTLRVRLTLGTGSIQ